MTPNLLVRAIAPSFARLTEADSAQLFVSRAKQLDGYFDSTGGRKQVGVVELIGTVSKRYALQLRDKVNMLAANDSVGEILLYIDSPGGSVNGTHDLYQTVRRAAESKRVTAFAEDNCCSAAFEVACGATEIICNPTCAVGSIGTYVVLADASRMFEKMGVDIIVVRSGPNKGVGVEGTKISAEEIAQVQQYVDSINRHFLAAVAHGRRMRIDRVQDLADGRVFVGVEAVAAGLVDRVALFEDVLFEVAERNAPKPKPPTPPTPTPTIAERFGPAIASQVDRIKAQAKLIAEREREIRRRELLAAHGIA